MTTIKPSDHGIVVDHKESNVRFAISDKNYDSSVHRKVRDLRPGETVRGYQPKPRSEDSEGVDSSDSGTGTTDQEAKSARGGSEPVADGRKATRTEGSASAASQEKEGK